MRFTRKDKLSFAREYARRSSGGRMACVGTRAMPFGFARVIHDGMSAINVAELADNSLLPGFPLLGSDWSMSF
jgi:hypothetical protein